MMEKIEDLICRFIYNYMKERVHLIKPFSTFDKNIKWIDYGFLSEDDFFIEISTDVKSALWCLTELMDWGMDCNHRDKFLQKEEDDFSVYKIEDRYFKIIDYLEPVEVKKIEKTIVIEVFEEL
jgi:hypothetical protein